MPAAVETLRVVVGPAHQHWLLRGCCQGKRKGNYLLCVVITKFRAKDQPPLPAAARLGEESLQGGPGLCLSAAGSIWGSLSYVLC